MNTRVLMGTAAAFTALLGVATSFAPREIAMSLGSDADRSTAVILQVAGAMYLGYAAMNWAARGVLIGGIYSRPLALANFFHLGIGSVVIGKALADDFSLVLAAVLLPYAVLAAGFGYVMFAKPPVGRASER